MHLKNAFAIILSATVTLVAGSALGEVTSYRVETRNDVFDGHVVNDIFINFTEQYVGSQLYLELEAGEIHQHANGANTAPDSGIADLVPGLQWDTYVTQGDEFSNTSNGVPALGGGAVNLAELGENPGNLGKPIPSSSTFDSSVLNQQFNPAPGLVIDGASDFMVARLTLSEDAAGQVVLASFAGPGDVNAALRLNATIANGVIGDVVVIPEPSTIALLGICLVGSLITLKRRKA